MYPVHMSLRAVLNYWSQNLPAKRQNVQNKKKHETELDA